MPSLDKLISTAQAMHTERGNKPVSMNDILNREELQYMDERASARAALNRALDPDRGSHKHLAGTVIMPSRSRRGKVARWAQDLPVADDFEPKLPVKSNAMFVLDTMRLDQRPREVQESVVRVAELGLGGEKARTVVTAISEFDAAYSKADFAAVEARHELSLAQKEAEAAKQNADMVASQNARLMEQNARLESMVLEFSSMMKGMLQQHGLSPQEISRPEGTLPAAKSSH